jgi:hypothetical protein
MELRGICVDRERLKEMENILEVNKKLNEENSSTLL